MAIPVSYHFTQFTSGGLRSSLPAVYSDWSILSKLLLCFVHLSNEINEAFSSFWHSLLRPVSEL